MIYLNPDYSRLFSQFRTVDDYLKIEVDLVRDFKKSKNRSF